MDGETEKKKKIKVVCRHLNRAERQFTEATVIHMVIIRKGCQERALYC